MVWFDQSMSFTTFLSSPTSKQWENSGYNGLMFFNKKKIRLTLSPGLHSLGRVISFKSEFASSNSSSSSSSSSFRSGSSLRSPSELIYLENKKNLRISRTKSTRGFEQNVQCKMFRRARRRFFVEKASFIKCLKDNLKYIGVNQNQV